MKNWDWHNVYKNRTTENTIAQFALIGVGLTIYAVYSVIASHLEVKRLRARYSQN